MRKVVVLVVFIVIAASAGAYVYFYQPFAKETPLESVMPGDTVGFVRFCELKKQIERFRAGRMGQSFAKIDLGGTMDAMGVAGPEQELVNRFLADAKNMVDSAWFDMLFGKDVALAVQAVQVDAAMLDSRDPQPFMDALVMVARPRQPTRVLESLNSMFSTQLEVQKQTYGQWEINQVDPQNGMPLYYALSDGLLIAGFSAKPVQKCLDQSANPQTSLMNAGQYRANAAGLYAQGRTDMVAFLDGAYLLDSLQRVASQHPDSDQEMAALKQQLKKMRGIRDISMVSYDDGGPLVQTRTIIGVDRDAISVDLSRALSIKPALNPTLKNMPSDALVYSWQNTLDLKQYWQSMRENLEIPPDKVAEIRDMFAEKTGMPLETVLDALGTQAGLLVKDINTGGFLPIPEMALFIEVKKQDVIDQLIKQQIGQMNMPLQSEAHNGVDIHYLTLPAGGNLSPAYAYKDGFCNIAINRTLLTKMLDAAGQTGLPSHPDFKSVDKGLSAENNQVVYLNTAGLTAKARDLVNWGMAWMAMAKPDEADKTRRVVEQAVFPAARRTVHDQGGRRKNLYRGQSHPKRCVHAVRPDLILFERRIENSRCRAPVSLIGKKEYRKDLCDIPPVPKMILRPALFLLKSAGPWHRSTICTRPATPRSIESSSRRNRN